MNRHAIIPSGCFAPSDCFAIAPGWILRAAFGFALLLAFACAAPASRAQVPPGPGQFPQDPMGKQFPQDQPGNRNPLDQGQPYPGLDNPAMATRRLQALNAERQKSMVADTDKLVKLAAELNAQLNGTHGGDLTPAQMRMVADIEKLAHNIRQKMSMPITGTPPMMTPRPMIPGIP